MTDYPAAKLRNFALIGHGGTGKTSLAEAMLFAAGAITRLGRVEDGTTSSDWDPDEIKRNSSINLSILRLEWSGLGLNVIDTPGYADFAGEVICAVRAADSAMIVVDAASGVQVGTEYGWQYALERGLPRAFFINRMDRDNSDFFTTLGQIRDLGGQMCLPIHLPIGAQSEFNGVLDLIKMRSFTGNETEPAEPPAELAEQADEWRQRLVEAAAETDEALIEKYLEGEGLSIQDVVTGLRHRMSDGNLVPVFVGSATSLTGVQQALETVTAIFPSPADSKVATDEHEIIVPDPNGPLAASVFKTMADPYVGRLTYFRVLSGTLKSDSQTWNASSRESERIGPLYRINGKNQEQVTQVLAGDIGGVAKLVNTTTGDTLCDKDRPMKVDRITFPPSAIGAAVHPKTKGDLDKMGSALQRITEEDPSLQVERRSETAETILSGLGDNHLDVAVEKIRRKFGVGVDLTVPKVPYRETVKTTAEAEHTHKKQSGGHGQFARVAIRVEPLPRGRGFEFVNKIVGGAIPKNYIPSVEKGVVEALADGVLSHHRLTDMRVTLFDGKEHPVDSSDIAFKIAGAAAIKQGALEAKPVLLEPIVKMRITLPEANTGDVMSDLNGKRGKVLDMTPQGSLTTIEAEAPLAEVQRYSADLRSVTQGRGRYTMTFDHYSEVPAHISQRIVEETRG